MIKHCSSTSNGGRMEGDSKKLNLNLWSPRRHIADMSFFNCLFAINHSIAWWSTNGASKFDQSRTASTELRTVFPLVFTMLSFVCVFHVCAVVYLQFSSFGVCLRTVWCKSSFSSFRRWNMLPVTFVHFDNKKTLQWKILIASCRLFSCHCFLSTKTLHRLDCHLHVSLSDCLLVRTAVDYMYFLVNSQHEASSYFYRSEAAKELKYECDYFSVSAPKYFCREGKRLVKIVLINIQTSSITLWCVPVVFFS